jgi:hypothetical protein
MIGVGKASWFRPPLPGQSHVGARSADLAQDSARSSAMWRDREVETGHPACPERYMRLTCLPSRQSGRAGLPHPAFQSVGPLHGLARLPMGLLQRVQPTGGEECVGPALMVGTTSPALALLAFAQDASQPHAHLRCPGHEVSADSSITSFRPFRLQPPDMLRRRFVTLPISEADLPAGVFHKVWASPFPRQLAAVAGRIEFTCVTDWPFTSGCSPPGLTATQLPSVTGRRTHARRGLAPL